MLENFGKRLKEARLANDYSQRGLGLALGLSDKTISSYESGRSYPNLEILGKITEVLDRPLGYFLVLSDDKQEIGFFLEEILKKQNQLDKDIQSLLKILKQEE